MFTLKMYSSMMNRFVRLIEKFQEQYPELSGMKDLSVIGAKDWLEVAMHFASRSNLAIYNHNKTWIIHPPDIEAQVITNKKELLMALHYINWPWDYTDKFKALFDNPQHACLGVAQSLVHGTSKTRSLVHFEV